MRRAVLLLCLLLLTACTGGDPEAAPSATPSPTPADEETGAEEAAPSEGEGEAPQVEGEVVVFAAASLTDAFEEVGAAFEAQYPDATVTFNFAGSQQLATQILEGATPDLFAAAAQAPLDRVGEANLVAAAPTVFATNALEIAVEPGNPLRVTGLADLADPELAVVLAAEDVPAGQYAREALTAAGVQVSPVSQETDVRAVLSRVELGEADAGIVYRSDIVAAGDAVAGVEIPDADNVVATYPISLLAAAPNLMAAIAFQDVLLGEEGQAILADHGFTQP